MALLNLTPELQARIGEEPIDLLRAVGNRPHHEQEAALEELKAQRALNEAEKQARNAQPRVPEAPPTLEQATDSTDYAVITELATPEQPNPPAPETKEARGGSKTVPVPRADSKRSAPRPAVEAPHELPYDNGPVLAMHLIQKMSDTEFDKMLGILNEHQQRVSAAKTANE